MQQKKRNRKKLHQTKDDTQKRILKVFLIKATDKLDIDRGKNCLVLLQAKQLQCNRKRETEKYIGQKTKDKEQKTHIKSVVIKDNGQTIQKENTLNFTI